MNVAESTATLYAISVFGQQSDELSDAAAWTIAVDAAKAKLGVDLPHRTVDEAYAAMDAFNAR